MADAVERQEVRAVVKVAKEPRTFTSNGRELTGHDFVLADGREVGTLSKKCGDVLRARVDKEVVLHVEPPKGNQRSAKVVKVIDPSTGEVLYDYDAQAQGAGRGGGGSGGRGGGDWETAAERGYRRRVDVATTILNDLTAIACTDAKEGERGSIGDPDAAASWLGSQFETLFDQVMAKIGPYPGKAADASGAPSGAAATTQPASSTGTNAADGGATPAAAGAPPASANGSANGKATKPTREQWAEAKAALGKDGKPATAADVLNMYLRDTGKETAGTGDITTADLERLVKANAGG